MTFDTARALVTRVPFARELLSQRFEKKFRTKAGVGCLCGAYRSFEEATRAAPTTGYDTDAAGELYRDRMQALLPRDYPVLFWLARALPQARTVFDLGGHVGVLYYLYRRYLELPAGLPWTVCDVPAVVRAGEALARERGETALRFTSEARDADGAGVLLASGSLQYIPQRLDALLAGFRARPRHVIVSQTPVSDSPEYFTLQNIGVAICPYRIANRGEFAASMAALGYECVDTWEDPERHTAVRYQPETTPIAYAGWSFRLRPAPAETPT